MFGRGWFKKDVLIPILLLVVFGYGLFKLKEIKNVYLSTLDSKLISYLFFAGIIIYILLVLVTLRHAAASYSLERFNPGNPQSLKRLMKMRRFRLNRKLQEKTKNWVAPIDDITQWLQTRGYRAAARTPHGRVFEKRRRFPAVNKRAYCDRVFLLEHDLLNVLVVDQLLRDSIRYIKQRTDEPSPRNMIIFIMKREDAVEAASTAAGVVNFLGKFNGSSLGVLLFDLNRGRLYYPIDRSLQARSHRTFQDLLRFSLLYNLNSSSQQVRLTKTMDVSEYTAARVRKLQPEHTKNDTNSVKNNN